jgi:short-subunit dehydrogenase
MNIVITGASRGIGRAIAQAFAQEGHQLFLSSKNEKALLQAKEVIATLSPGCIIHTRAADLGEDTSAVALGSWVLEKGGAPDVLINNAGSFNPGSTIDEPNGVLEEMLRVNLLSAYHLTRTLVPAMIKRGSGHIFNLCSIASLGAYPGGGSYSISKFALYGFSKNLRMELMPHGIKVTHVIPGAVYTDSWANSGVEANRIMEAEDIAKMVAACTSLSVRACVEEIILRPVQGDL